MQAAGRIFNRRYISYMEVLMRKIISAFLVISIALAAGVVTSYSQKIGMRVEAEIPFDFTIGKQTFAAGNYELSVFRLNGPVHLVRVFDRDGKVICNTTAIQNGSTVRKQSDMLFAVIDGQRYLDKIRTPEFGYLFSWSAGDKRVAKAKRVSVPTAETSPNF